MKKVLMIWVALVFGFVFNGYAQKTYKGLTGEEWYKTDKYKYCRLAAKLDYAPAQFDLADWYRRGFSKYSFKYNHILFKNTKKAYELYSKSAENGYAKAQYEMAYAYDRGNHKAGIEKNYMQAEYWALKAAKQNFEKAYTILYWLYDGYAYSFAKMKNYDKALYWYKQDFKLNNNYSIASNIANIYFSGCNGEYKKDYKQALQWYETAYNKYSKSCYTALKIGKIYEEGGYGVAQDFAKSGNWYNYAVSDNSCKDEAQKCLNRIQPELDKIRLQKLENEAKLLANSTDAAKIYNLAYRYKDEGMDDKAFVWFKKAANLGYTDAQVWTGNCYYNGKGTTQNYKNAIFWYQKAAAKKDKYALYNLGLCYENGYGVTKNKATAMSWHKKAADLGYSDAKARYKALKGPSAKLIKVWNETTSNWLSVHIKFSTDNMDGTNATVGLNIYHPNKTKMRGNNYTAPDGYAGEKKNCSLSKEIENIEDFIIEFPLSDLDAKTGKRTYYYTVVLYTYDGKELFRSTYHPFIYEKKVVPPVNNNVAQNNNYSNSNSNNGTFPNGHRAGDTWSANGSEYKQLANGTVVETWSIQCSFCQGTDVCFLCHGSGGTYVWNNYVQCTSCNGSGKCTACTNGRQQFKTTKYPPENFPNYTPSLNNYTSSNGNDNSGTTSNNNHYQTCYECKGTGRCKKCISGACRLCHGFGYYEIHVDGTVGCEATAKDAIKCTRCFARGYCPTCGGSDKCQKCGGSGKLTN